MRATQRLSLEEFLELPEEKPALEFEDGIVTRKAMPGGHHSCLQTELAERFNRFARPRRLALAFTELRTTWAGRSYVPDVSVYRWNRIPVDPSGWIADDFREPPDIAVEMLSPKQGVTRQVERCLWYVANGVQVALLVDPKEKSVLAFRAGQPTLALRETDPIAVDEVLPGFALTVQELFDSLRLE